MPTVPIITQNTQTQGGAVVGGRATTQATNLSLPDKPITNQTNKAIAGAGGIMAEIGFERAAAIKDKLRKVSLLESQNSLNEFEREQKSIIQQSKGKNAIGIAPETGKKFDSYADKLYQNAPDDDTRLALNEMLISRKAALLDYAQGYEDREIDSYSNQTYKDSVDSALQRAGDNFNDFGAIESSIKQAEDTYRMFAQENGYSATTTDLGLKNIRSEGVYSALENMANVSPESAAKYYDYYKDELTGDAASKARKLIAPIQRQVKVNKIVSQVENAATPVVSVNDALNFVMNDLEGGDKITADTGGVTRYGISQNANPDVDVSKLTPMKAAFILRRDYYDKVVDPNMPPDMKLVAFDAAVSHGEGTAKELIKQSGGDARLLLDLRAKEYTRLARENPDKYGKYLDGWKNRLSKVETQIDMMRGTPADAATQESLVAKLSGGDSEVYTDAMEIVQKRTKARQEAQKGAFDNAKLEALQYKVQGLPIPASVEVKMNPDDVLKMREEKTDPLVYEKVRADILSGKPVVLADHAFQLGEKYYELVKLQQDPKARESERSIDDVLGSAIRISFGKTETDNKNQAAEIEQFRRSFYQRLEEAEKAKGSKLDYKEKQAVADYIMQKIPSGSMWHSDKPLWESAPEDVQKFLKSNNSMKDTSAEFQRFLSE